MGTASHRDLTVTPAGSVPDIIAPGLDVLFCGINPGTRSGELGQHFARPGNRFWKALYGAGFTDRLLTPAEQEVLLDYGLGITNLVTRTSKAAAELTKDELRAGSRELDQKVAEMRPRWVAILGMQAYRSAFGRPDAAIGRQRETIGAGSGLWLLPNPSGLQARYQLPELIERMAELREASTHPRINRT